MNRTPDYGVDATISVCVGDKEPLSLRLVSGAVPYLIMGPDENVSILLSRSQVAAVHEQAGVVLTELLALEQHESKVASVQLVGLRAGRMADHARRQANKAEAAGATQQAEDARTAADTAEHAAAAVHVAVKAAYAVLDKAEEALETAGAAAAAAAQAAAEDGNRAAIEASSSAHSDRRPVS
jgi:hypothetical protein